MREAIPQRPLPPIMPVAGVVMVVIKLRNHPALGFLDGAERLFRADTDDVAIGFYHVPVLLRGCVKTSPPVAGGVAEIFVEHATLRVMGILGTVVPFPESPGRVSGRFQGICEVLLVEVDPLAPGGNSLGTRAPMVTAGEHLGTGGGAKGANEEIFQRGPVLCDGVDVRL